MIFEPNEDFIEKCEQIVNHFGVPNSIETMRAHALGVVPYDEQTISYKDDVVKITRSTSSKALTLVELKNNKPILYRDSDGNIDLFKEQYIDLIEHIDYLISLLKN